MFETIAQWMIIILGGGAALLASMKKESWRKWGYVAGAFSCPFFVYTAWNKDQFGVLLLAIWYFYTWCLGIWNFVIAPTDWFSRYKYRLHLRKTLEERTPQDQDWNPFT